jgi:hypothetical protein
LVTYLENIPDTEFLKLSDWKFRDSEEEDLQSLRIVSELYKSKSIFNGRGFILGDSNMGDLITETNRFLIPLCMNLRKQGLVYWLDVDGIFYRETKNKFIVGVRIEKTLDFYPEVFSRTFPTSGLPAFKLCSEWPSLSLYMKESTKMQMRYDDWHVGIRFNFRPKANV